MNDSSSIPQVSSTPLGGEQPSVIGTRVDGEPFEPILVADASPAMHGKTLLADQMGRLADVMQEGTDFGLVDQPPAVANFTVEAPQTGPLDALFAHLRAANAKQKGRHPKPSPGAFGGKNHVDRAVRLTRRQRARIEEATT